MTQPKRLDVEVYQGKVVAVWFGCVALPFTIHNCNEERGRDMISMTNRIEEDINNKNFDPSSLLTNRLRWAYGPPTQDQPTPYQYHPPSEDITSREE